MDEGASTLVLDIQSWKGGRRWKKEGKGWWMEEFALHFERIGGATALVASGVEAILIQR